MKDGIKINGHYGTWYVIDEDVFHRPTRNGIEDIPVYLLEHEQYGDEAAGLIIDDNMDVVLEDVWNGFDDLREYEEELEYELKVSNVGY